MEIVSNKPRFENIVRVLCSLVPLNISFAASDTEVVDYGNNSRVNMVNYLRNMCLP